jgi:hypothetical protein
VKATGSAGRRWSDRSPVSASATAKSVPSPSRRLIVPVGDAPAAPCQAASATLPGRGKQTDRVSMSTSTLFPEPTTPSTGPLANLEPHVVWLQRSTQPEAAAARRSVNAWY